MRIKINTNKKSVTRGLRVGELLFFVAIFMFLFVGSPAASAAFNENINYQGKLTDGSAIPVSDGAYDIVFRLYDAAAGGSTVWTESLNNANLWTETASTTVTRNAAGCGGSGFTSIVYATGTNENSIAVGQTIWNTTLKESAVVTGITTGTNTLCVSNPYSSWANSDDLTNRVYVKSGLFSVMMGTVSSFSAIDFNQTLYLGVTVGNDPEMSPRKMIGALPAAFTAKTLNNNGSASIGTNAGSTLSIGNTTGAVTMNSGGTSAWTNTSGGLTISTATSGTLALNSAGALNLSSAAASTVTLANVANALNFDSDTLTIDALNNRIGIGTNAPSATLDIAGSMTDSNGTSSIYHNPTITQSVAGYTNYGYKMVLNNTLSWGTDTTYGIHVTNSSGAAGARHGIYAYAVNNAIYGQGGTYGVYGDNSAYGTGVGVYGKTTGTSAGNALKAESTTITSSNLSVFNQATSAFSGTGLLMNFANSTGSFTGNFVDLQKNSVSQFKIDANGAVTGGTYNGLTVSSTTGTLTLASGSTLATSGGNSVTLTSTGTTNATLPSGTVTLMANPMTAPGDLIYGGTSGSPTKLAGSGTNGWVLAYNTATNTPYWTAPGGGSQTPWTGDINAAGYDLGSLSNLLFQETTGTPTGTDVGFYRDNSGDLTGNVLTGKTLNIAVNGTDEYNFSSTGLAFNSNNITGLGTNLTAAGALTIASTSSGLTFDSGSNTTTIDSSDTALTASGVTTLTLGAGVTITNASGNINIQPAGTGTGNVQIGDGGTSSATPDLLVLDTGSAEPTGTVGAMYYSTALNKFRCYQNTSWTDCIGSVTGGSPAGSNTQIQYNSSGSFGANAGLTFDSSTQTLGLNGTDAAINMTGITTEPTAPAAGTMDFYAKSIAGRMMPKWIGPSGLDSIVQPMVAMNKVAWWNPPGNATTAPGVLGMAAQTIVSNGGTALTSRSVATTNLFTRMKRAGIVSTTTAGYIASMRNGTAQFTVGNGSGLGGFTYVARFGSTDAISAARAFVGFTSSTAVPTNVEPSTLTNAIGMCQLSTSNNWQICYGGSAAQTPIDLGANFPANTSSADMYELVLFAPTNVNNVVNYRVTRLGTAYQASGTLTAATPGTQLPAATTLLASRFWKTNNTAASVVGLDIASLYIETDY